MWALYEISWEGVVAVGLLAAREHPHTPYGAQVVLWEAAGATNSLKVIPGFEYLLQGTEVVAPPSAVDATITIRRTFVDKISERNTLESQLNAAKLGHVPKQVVDQRAVGAQWQDWSNGDLGVEAYAYFNALMPVDDDGTEEEIVVGIRHTAGPPIVVEDVVLLFERNSRFTMFFGGRQKVKALGDQALTLTAVAVAELTGDYKRYSYEEEHIPIP